MRGVNIVKVRSGEMREKLKVLQEASVKVKNISKLNIKAKNLKALIKTLS